jgi:hypothetical protein
MDLHSMRRGRALLLATVLLAGCGGAEDTFAPVGPDVGTPETALSPTTLTATTLAPTTTAPPALVRYVGDGYTISLPGKGELQKQTVQTPAGPVEASIVMVDLGDDSGYSVVSNAVPASGWDLDGAARGAATSAEGTLSDVSKVTYKGSTGRDYRISRAQDQRTIFSRMLIVKKKSILVQAVLNGDLRTPPPTYTQVLESLTF